MIPNFISKPDDLVTKHKDTVQGFLEQAKSKIVEANPFLQEAKELKKSLSNVKGVKSLREYLENNPGELPIIATSVGFSDKSLSHFTTEELKEAVLDAISEIFDLDSDNLVEELGNRYLLTRGDSLGGVMRNLVGREGANKFTDKLLSELENAGIEFKTKKTRSGKINRIYWQNKLLYFDITPSFIGKNIDFILVEDQTEVQSLQQLQEDLKNDPSSYLACGEIKSGIDPAGADEHWKTARSALVRIREGFDEQNSDCPNLFFVGMAIENAMAVEIFNMLEQGKLAHAANLSHEEQLTDLVRWLVGL